MPKRDIIQTTLQQQLVEIIFLGYEQPTELQNTTSSAIMYYVLEGHFMFGNVELHQHQAVCIEPGQSRMVQCINQGSLLEISLKEQVRKKTPDADLKSLWVKPPRTL